MAKRHKLGANKIKNEKENGVLNSPATLGEVIQLARGVAADMLAEYQYTQRHLQLSMSMQLELIKEILINAGLVTAEEFKERYKKQVDEFNERQREALEKEQSQVKETEDSAEVVENEPKISTKVNDIEVTTL